MLQDHSATAHRRLWARHRPLRGHAGGSRGELSHGSHDSARRRSSELRL